MTFSEIMKKAFLPLILAIAIVFLAGMINVYERRMEKLLTSEVEQEEMVTEGKVAGEEIVSENDKDLGD